jgi:hypothetical protein
MNTAILLLPLFCLHAEPEPRTTEVFSGADLMRDGLTISVEPERRSELLLFEAQWK